MDLIKKLIIKYKGIILYGIFGVLTTALNIAVYYVCYNVVGISNVVSTILAWIAGVLFAFFTNKIWVFDSKSFTTKLLLKEFIMFVTARLLTGLFDLAFMYITVDVLQYHALTCKIISNVVVIILNYVLSKFVVFKKK